ncbi:MAG: hypothetical protein H6907_16385 [Hyphomicrobiales bacterium]|nr:hypothetical protein [Hyphomicrobiales bacterium]MCP5373305.1 hypothetical protein [Hyphomicrobiales bacterium]
MAPERRVPPQTGPARWGPLALAVAAVLGLVLAAAAADAGRIEPPDPLRELRHKPEKSLSERYSAILKKSQMDGDLGASSLLGHREPTQSDPAFETPASSSHAADGLSLLDSEQNLVAPAPVGDSPAPPVVRQRYLDALRGTVAPQPQHQSDQWQSLRSVIRPFVNSSSPSTGGGGGLGDNGYAGDGYAGDGGGGAGQNGGRSGGQGGRGGDSPGTTLPVIDSMVDEFAAMLIEAVLSPEELEKGKITFSIFGFGTFELIRLRNGGGFRLLEHENELAMTFDSPRTQKEVAAYEQRRQDGEAAAAGQRSAGFNPGGRGSDMSLREFAVYLIMKALTEPILYAFAALLGLLVIARNMRRA